MLSVDFLIVDRIPCGRFHANISRIPNIGETGLQEFDAAYVVKLIEKEENKEIFSCAAELKTGLENQENLAAAAKKH